MSRTWEDDEQYGATDNDVRPLMDGYSEPTVGRINCIGCSHVPHDPRGCGAWAYTATSNRCLCTYDRTQVYEVRRGS